MSSEARKIVTYSCGCIRGVVGVPGQEPRPPMVCPDHGGEFESGETLDIKTGKPWRAK